MKTNKNQYTAKGEKGTVRNGIYAGKAQLAIRKELDKATGK